MISGVDQSGRRLVDPEHFEIDQAAQARTDVVVERIHRQRVTHLIEEIIRRDPGCGNGDEAEADDLEGLHETLAVVPAVCGARRKRTSNSVQSFSELSSRKSPPCRRASSRARFKPRPWPVISSPTEPRWKRSKMC